MRLQGQNPDHEMADEALVRYAAAEDAETRRLNAVRSAAGFTFSCIRCRSDAE